MPLIAEQNSGFTVRARSYSSQRLDKLPAIRPQLSQQGHPLDLTWDRRRGRPGSSTPPLALTSSHPASTREPDMGGRRLGSPKASGPADQRRPKSLI